MVDTPQDSDNALLARLNALKKSSITLETAKCVAYGLFI